MLLRLIADALFVRGHGLLQAGHALRALPQLALAARLSGSNPYYFATAAAAASQAGDRERAAVLCERALALDAQFTPAHELMASLYLHGEKYSALLERIHRHLRPRTYVEIGVESGASLRLALPETRALGVDPEPKIAFALPAGAQLFAQTSDEFFARPDLGALLGGLPLELALIDGMHHFEYALRDFMNLERLCAPGAAILIHDVFPHDRTTAQRERVMHFWSGDIWRLVVLLKKYRPGLAIHTIAAPPTGLALVRNLDPGSRFIADNLERLCAEFLALDYGYLERDRAGKLNLFPNDWERIRPLLG